MRPLNIRTKARTISLTDEELEEDDGMIMIDNYAASMDEGEVVAAANNALPPNTKRSSDDVVDGDAALGTQQSRARGGGGPSIVPRRWIPRRASLSSSRAPALSSSLVKKSLPVAPAFVRSFTTAAVDRKSHRSSSLTSSTNRSSSREEAAGSPPSEEDDETARDATLARLFQCLDAGGDGSDEDRCSKGGQEEAPSSEEEARIKTSDDNDDDAANGDPGSWSFPKEATGVVLRPHSRRSSLASSCDGGEDSFLSGEASEGADLPRLLDSTSMLINLGRDPTSSELEDIAAVRARECIDELFGRRGGAGGGFLNSALLPLDRGGWEYIPQYSKSNLTIGKHLGKGTFSDAFEVVATVTMAKEDTRKAIDISDKDDLDRLIAAKFDTTPSNNENVEKVNGERTPADSLQSEATSKTILQGLEGEEQGPRDFQSDMIRPRRARRQTMKTGHSSLQPTVRKRQVTYAMKCLRPKIRSDANQFIIGVEDLVKETAMLASLDHPNIIRLHGRADSSFSLHDGYFILLDRLTDTLEDRIVRWKGASCNNRAVLATTAASSRSPSPAQLQTASSIADALAYLHSRDVVFRDLKPANVGFDSRGVLKLFDFGFAACVANGGGADNDGDGRTTTTTTKTLYEVCGTPRYMAPEVGLEKGYSVPADTYSFGILLWEICALRRPFGNIKTGNDLHRSVFEGGKRPKTSRRWPRALRDIMTRCWSDVPDERPTMEVVKTRLRELHVGDDGSSSSSRREQQHWGLLNDDDAPLRKSWMLRRLSIG